MAGDKSSSEVHESLTVPAVVLSNEDRQNDLIAQLDEIVASSEKNDVVLLVDEAQHLVKDNAFLFRCFRWWLRQKRKDKKRVVAVFSGTTPKLTNFYVERPLPSYSRDGPSIYYQNEGKKLYSPFFHLSTCGAGKSDPPNDHTGSDFHRSVKYGRPLFHVLQKNGNLNDETLNGIQKRLLITCDHETSEVSWLSVLAARVQMGQVSLDIASTLISLGYSNLTHFEEVVRNTEGDNRTVTIQQCHFPDPVLAFCAMKLMNENRQEWSKRAMKLFSSGMCLPEKRDTGKVFNNL